MYDDLVYTSNQDDIRQYALTNGDLLFNRTNSDEKVGKVAIFRGVKPCIYAGYLVRFRPISCDSEYINYLMNTRYQWLFCQSVKSDAVNQSNISASKFTRFIVPLPPLAEQKRIVAKIEELFAEVEKVAAAKDVISRTAERINKKVLDLAIRGQLVPQDPNDEPADKLLERIRVSRIGLTGLKSDTPNPVNPVNPVEITHAPKRSHTSAKGESLIFRGADRSAYETRNGKTVCIDDEIPFEIPDSWAWARLGTVLLPMESKIPVGEWFEYIDIDAIDNKQNRVTAPKKIKVKDAPSRASRGLRSGDTLFSVVRPYLRNIAHIDEHLASCIASTGFYVCRPSQGIDDQYLFMLLISDYVVNGLNAFMKGDNSPSIRVEHIHDFLVPLPPLAGQRRIVAKIEEVRKLMQSLTK